MKNGVILLPKITQQIIAIPAARGKKGALEVKAKRTRRPFNKTRLKNQILNVVKNPFNLIVAISLVILFCLIVIPLLQMVASTFTVAKGELRRLPGAEVGDFTLYYWKYRGLSFL